MTIIDSLTKEFKNEAQTTRKHFERLPNDKLDWRPHEKSFTTGGCGTSGCAHSFHSERNANC